MSLNESQKARVDTLKLIVEILLAELKGAEGTTKSAAHRHLRMTNIALRNVLDHADD